jgi:hypothetical protein
VNKIDANKANSFPLNRTKAIKLWLTKKGNLGGRFLHFG